MLNVLPIEVKKKLMREYIIRVVILALVFVGVAGCVTALSLVPAFVLAKSDSASLEAFVTETGEAEGEDVFGVVRAIKEKTALFDTKKVYSPLAFFSKAVDVRGSGIVLDGYSYTKDGGVISLRGTAGTRAGLVAYRDALGKIEGVTSVELPVSELAKSTDIRFTLTIKLSP